MNELALVSVTAGAVIIAVRGPFVLAPAASAATARRLIASSSGRNARFLDDHLDTPLTPTDKIDIFPAIAGGAH